MALYVLLQVLYDPFDTLGRPMSSEVLRCISFGACSYRGAQRTAMIQGLLWMLKRTVGRWIGWVEQQYLLLK
jgi:hypothetical protein